MEKNKRIKFKHIRALRDLGGFYNGGHLKIKKGLIYRSSYLGKMSLDESDNFVNRFNIGTVIDLRTPDEVELSKDIKTNAVEYVHFPILRNEDNPVVTKENRTDILLNIVKNRGGAINHLEPVYRKMVSDPYSLEYFRKIFDILLLDSNKSVVYHCTQGKDRTGVCSALILLSLGVDEKSIMHDYKKFNTPYRFKNVMISILSCLRFFSLRVSITLYFLQMAHHKLLEATFDEIHSKYGSVDYFLQEGLLLNPEKISKLKEKYLVK